MNLAMQNSSKADVDGLDQAEEEYPPEPKRFWTYSRESWDPPLRHKLGLPFFGSDEWGRRTVVVGLWFTGALVVALWTCWCPECHVGRARTYDDARPAIDSLRKKLYGGAA